MPNLTIQKIIYRNLVQRPSVNRVLDKLGFSGLTRNKAVLFASNNPVEVQKARKALLASEVARAERAIVLADTTKEKLLQNAKEIIKKCAYGSLNPKNIISAALEEKWTPEQILAFSEKMVKTPISYLIGESYFSYHRAFCAFQALPAVLETKLLTPEQTTSLFRKFVKDTSYYHNFAALSPALKKIKEVFTPEQTLDLLARIKKKKSPSGILKVFL